MLAEDNPGELWIDRGNRLFHEKHGPKKAVHSSSAISAWVRASSTAPASSFRVISDTDKVQDLESRLLTCMVELQGFEREDMVEERPSARRSPTAPTSNRLRSTSRRARTG